MSRVIVTGGAGFIGSHLVGSLLDEGHVVLVIDNLSTGRGANIKLYDGNKNFLFYKSNIEDENIESVFSDFAPEKVYHLAAIPGVQFSVEHPYESNKANVVGLLNILECSRMYGVKRLVFSSSSAVYGNTNVLPTNEKVELSPMSPYALQKKIGELYCKLYSELYGLDTVCLRYFNVMGPRQYGDSPYSSVVSLFANAIKNNQTPVIYGDGEQSRDFCPVENVVFANMLAGQHPSKLNGAVINIGMGQSTSVNKLLSLMKIDKANYLDARSGDVKHSMADISLAKELLGYEPIVDFESALKKTIDWYIKL